MDGSKKDQVWKVIVTKADGDGRGRRKTLLSIANSRVRKR